MGVLFLHTRAFSVVFSLGDLGLREPPGGPRSGCEARSEANPGRWRPVGARPNKLFNLGVSELVLVFLHDVWRCNFEWNGY